ncbi:MAG TPA: GNAT family N-acetyltransferase [Segeticoccus sp.]|nr:GNAT family N-acetyltransferase [Segeticoccus sp.]
MSSVPVRRWKVRAYAGTDENSWLRCRVLGFLDTSYFDDVLTSKPTLDGPQLVAVDGQGVVGVLDISIDGPLATVETIAVHPDHRRRGIATALLDEGRGLARQRGAKHLAAWTRDDAAALTWYRQQGFTERFRYLHVYASTVQELAAAVDKRSPLLPMTAFFHAAIEHEEQLRRQYARVHVCRQFVNALTSEHVEPPSVNASMLPPV